MSNKKNDSLSAWFPLSIYDKSLTDNEWLMEIVMRFSVYSLYENAKNSRKDGEFPNKRALDAFISLIIDHKRNGNGLTKTPSVNFWPVREPTPFESLFIAQEFAGDEYEEARLWAKKLHEDPEAWTGVFHADGVCKKLHKSERVIRYDKDGNVATPYYNEIIGKCTSVWIDLDHDDETLKLAFSVWLAGIRDHLKSDAKQPIGEKEFTKWTKYKLLGAVDLEIWSQLNKLNYTDAYIAKKLWPDFSHESDFVDVTERYRKVTKPMVKKVFDWNFIERFWKQIELLKAVASLVEEKKAERKSE